VKHLEPPVRPVAVGSLEGPRGAERDPLARREALVAIEFESVRFVEVPASVVARPIRRPGRSNIAGAIDDDSDDRVCVDAGSPNGEGVFAIRRPHESSSSRRGERSEGKFCEIANELRPRHLGPSGGPDRNDAKQSRTTVTPSDIEPVLGVDPHRSRQPQPRLPAKAEPVGLERLVPFPVHPSPARCTTDRAPDVESCRPRIAGRGRRRADRRLKPAASGRRAVRVSRPLSAPRGVLGRNRRRGGILKLGVH
jgi:hypothetical protein